MTLEEALRFIDPETDTDALAEAEYYGGFNGKEQAAQKLKEASRMVVDFCQNPTACPRSKLGERGREALLHHERTCVGLLRELEHHEGLD